MGEDTEQIKKVTEKVKDMMSRIEETRNSDTLLILELWVDQGKGDYSVQALAGMKGDGYASLMDAESITRARRKIQNDECIFLPTRPAVAIRRRIKEETYKQYYGEGSESFKEYIELRYKIE